MKSGKALGECGPREPIVNENPIDRFDNRLQWVRRRSFGKSADAVRRRKEAEAEVRDVSLYEFYDKHRFKSGRLQNMQGQVGLMVTPAFSSDCASVEHVRHEAYARTCVVAFWRHMPTARRYRMIEQAGLDADVRRWGGTVFEEPPVHAGAEPSEVDHFLGVRDLVMAFDGRKTREVIWIHADGARRAKMDSRCSVQYGWRYALMEMLVDPVLSKWVPEWIGEQYRRWNEGFDAFVREALAEDAAQEWSNRKVLRRVMQKAREAAKERARQKRKPGKEDEESNHSHAPESDAGAEGADAEQQLADLAAEDGREPMIREEQPSAGDDVCGGGGDGSGDWAGATAAERASAAGPAPAAADRGGAPARGARQVAGAVAQENPAGYDWEADNLVSAGGKVSAVTRSREKGFREQWAAWRGSAVIGSEEVVEREQLDAWQGFAYDILEQKADERERLVARGGGRRVGGVEGDEEGGLGPSVLRDYEPARVILTGPAGTGKSRSIRAIVARRRRRARRAGASEEAAGRSCVLAAPTGCASFQMKYGATTAHRAYGIPVGFLGPVLDRDNKTFKARVMRLRAARLYVLDEFSMISRQQLGKIEFRVQEALQSAAREFGRPVTLGGRDTVLAGDVRQMKPIDGESLFKEGAYKGKGMNLPPSRKNGTRGEAPAGTPSMEDLTMMGMAVRDGFEDVVMLREIFRVDRGSDDMPEAERAEYQEEAEEFLRVTNRLGDLTWTRDDHAWLARRNRENLSEEERKEFDEAPLLMDTRKPKRGADGGADADGADLMNARELEYLSRRTGEPILAIGGYHDKPEKDKDLRAELLDGDDFRRLEGTLRLCKGARVLLTHNLWVEAGLMNGALGRVRGYVWPEGGDPRSSESSKRAPLCVVVEFDDIDLGKDASGEPRNFFPELGPAGRKLVPIFRDSVASGAGDGVVRHQFPLTLAWALTHQKAQGMTLRRARILLSKRSAGQVGLGYVAVTRVKHPRHLMFMEPLPEHAAFQEAKWKEEFRARQRYRLRMAAKASRTLRKYGFCAADPWNSEEAATAEALICHLQAEGELQRRASGRLGRDAYVWPTDEPPVSALMARAVDRVAARAGAAERPQVEGVARRLLGEYHLPAVQEALGCLIPRALDPELDGKKPKGQAAAGTGPGGVALAAGRWQLNISQEGDLYRPVALSKGLLEFFLFVFRQVVATLGLPVVVGTHAVGELVGAAENAGALQETLRGMASWVKMVEGFGRAQELLLPLPQISGTALRECALVSVRPVQGTERLAEAGQLRVRVQDRLVPADGKSARAEAVAQHLDALVRGVRRHGGSDAVILEQAEFPVCDSSMDGTACMLGLVASRLCAHANVRMADVASGDFAKRARSGLRMGFSMLRAAADRNGERDVLRQLHSRHSCVAFLRQLSGGGDVVGEAGGPDSVGRRLVEDASADAARHVPAAEFHPMRLLTWNVAGKMTSASGPEWWRPNDKVAVMRGDLARWAPDVVALQECPEEGHWEGLSVDYTLVGAARVREDARDAGFVHLYVKRGLRAERVSGGGWPGVIAEVQVQGEVVKIVAAHLVHGPGAGAARLRQARTMFDLSGGGNVLLMGDLNVREDEMEGMLEVGPFKEAAYMGRSWDPARNKFHAGNDASGQAFDRIVYRGNIYVQSFLVNGARQFYDGKGFCMSDHYGVLGFMDVHACHGAEGAAAEAGRRRWMLTHVRDVACAQEQGVVEEHEHQNIQRDKEEQMAREEGQLAEAREALSRAVKARSAARIALREMVFGERALFGPRSEERFGKAGMPALDSPYELEVAGYEGLSGRGYAMAWSGSGGGSWPPPCGLGGKALSYANVFVQVMLRLPAVALWLERHGSLCEGGEARSCLSCALKRSRAQLGKTAAVSELVRRVKLAGDSYADQGLRQEHDVVQFFCDALTKMAEGEVKAGRVAAGAAVSGEAEARVTHVERMFGFLVEERWSCDGCFAVGKSSHLEYVYTVEPRESGEDQLVTDMCLERCVPRKGSRACGRRHCQASTCVQQSRLASLPNVLLVKVQRGGGARGRAICVEEQISFPGLGSLELGAAIYAVGAGSANVRYTCVCRGPGGFFWYFDGSRQPCCMGYDVSTLLRSNVVMLVYTRPGGRAVFGQRVRTGGASARRGPGEAAAAPCPSGGEVECNDDPNRRRAGDAHGAEGDRADGLAESGRKRVVQPDPWAVSRPSVSQRTARRGDSKYSGRRLERTVSDLPPTAEDLEREGNAAFQKLKAKGLESGTWVSPPRVWQKKLRHLFPDPAEEEVGAERSAHLAKGESPAGVGRQSDPAVSGTGVPDDMTQEESTRKRKAGAMEEWRRFTPPCINEGLCMARTWNAGRGGQCRWKPLDGSRLCKFHGEQQGQKGWHGEVDGEIPARKLVDFQKKGKPRADVEVFGEERQEVAGKVTAGSDPGGAPALPAPSGECAGERFDDDAAGGAVHVMGAEQVTRSSTNVGVGHDASVGPSARVSASGDSAVSAAAGERVAAGGDEAPAPQRATAGGAAGDGAGSTDVTPLPAAAGERALEGGVELRAPQRAAAGEAAAARAAQAATAGIGDAGAVARRRRQAAEQEAKGTADCIGASRRDRLREALERSRADAAVVCNAEDAVRASGATGAGEAASSSSGAPRLPARPFGGDVVDRELCQGCRRLGIEVVKGSAQCVQMQRETGCHACDRRGCWQECPQCTFFGRARVGHRDAAATGSAAPDMFSRVPVAIRRNARRTLVRVGEQEFVKGAASGENCNCLIQTFILALQDHVSSFLADPRWIRSELQRRFPSGPDRVTDKNYLDLRAHWRDIVSLISQSACRLGFHDYRQIRPEAFRVTCVYEARQVVGDVVGDGPTELFILNEHMRHFVPLLRRRDV